MCFSESALVDAVAYHIEHVRVAHYFVNTFLSCIVDRLTDKLDSDSKRLVMMIHLSFAVRIEILVGDLLEHLLLVKEQTAERAFKFWRFVVLQCCNWIEPCECQFTEKLVTMMIKLQSIFCKKIKGADDLVSQVVDEILKYPD